LTADVFHGRFLTFEISYESVFKNQDVEAVEYFLLPLSAPYKVIRFRVCLRFHRKNASAPGSSKSQMLPSWLPASFFKVLPFPQKLNRFQLPLPHHCFKLTSWDRLNFIQD